MRSDCPRVLIAGTASGCGKTTAVCAILTLLRRRGVGVTAAKCGPDYIDPMFHRSVLGVPSANLDPFFCEESLLRALLAAHAGEATVIEGVMGYYDGTGRDGTEYSTYSVAAATQTPVVLVVDARGAAASLLAVLEGFLRFRPDSRIVGVLFRGASPMTYAMLEKLLEARFGGAVRPLGYIPKLPEDCVLASRHLGLITAAEIAELREKLEKIADLCADTVDVDALLALARSAPPIAYDAPAVVRRAPVTIAAARDAAFCFYYDDTLALLERMGASICFFSPLADEPLPEEADGLLLGGGYPELYAETLEKNASARESVRRAVTRGLPTIAECGGFQYLGRSLCGRAMCGALPHESADAGRLVRFGYLTLTAQRAGLLGENGTVLRAHEFHYYDSTACGGDFTAEKPSGRRWTCAIHTDTLYAGYPHLFLPADSKAADAFYSACLKYKEKKHDHH